MKKLIIFSSCILFGCNSYEKNYDWGEYPKQEVIQRTIENFDLEQVEQVKEQNILLYKHCYVDNND